MLSRSAQGADRSPDRHEGADLQLVVRPEDLAKFSNTDEAEHLRRLEADQALMLQLNAEGFTGPAWSKLSTVLVQYGYAVMRAWITSGLIVSKCRDRGISLEPLVRALNFHDIADLTQDVVAEAIVAFRDHVIAKGVWNPQRGASLATFFIGMCINTFPNARRSWNRQRERWHSQQSVHTVPENLTSTPSAEAIAEHTLELQRTLGAVKDETNRVLLALQIQGYSLAEISELTGLSYKQIESRLFRTRSVLRTRRAKNVL